MAYRQFFNGIATARNRYENARVLARQRGFDPDVDVAELARAAVWLVPASVGKFQVGEFVMLGPEAQATLAEAVAAFESVALQVDPDRGVTEEQYREGEVALQVILRALGKWGEISEEGAKIRAAVQQVEMPPEVLNWDYQVDTNEYGDPLAWIMLFLAPDRPRGQPETLSISLRVRKLFNDLHIDRISVLRVRSVDDQFKIGRQLMDL